MLVYSIIPPTKLSFIVTIPGRAIFTPIELLLEIFIWNFLKLQFHVVTILTLLLRQSFNLSVNRLFLVLNQYIVRIGQFGQGLFTSNLQTTGLLALFL